MDTENDLAALLRRQDGVVSRAQALACGLTRAAIDHRLARGLWTLLWPCVYLSAAHALGPRVRVRAASLWLGPGATLIGAGAAWWWRLLDATGREVPDVREGGPPRFTSQGDAESWVGECWRELLDDGVESVVLLEGDREVYGPMSLQA